MTSPSRRHVRPGRGGGVSHRARLQPRLALVLVGTVMALAGCSGGESGPSATDPYAAEYQQAIEAANSDFVKAVLVDHEVTDEEFAESQDSLVSCLREQGFEPGITTDNGRRVVNVPADADSSCVDQWSGDIESLYWAERVNPHNKNMYDLVAACLARTKLAPEGFTGKDLEELDAQAQGSYTVTQGGEKTDETLPENENPTLPSGMAIRAEETIPCWTSPLTTGLG